MGMGISIAIATNDRNEFALRPPLRPGLLGARSADYETLAEGVILLFFLGLNSLGNHSLAS